jgi:ABC-type multidrug transport system ATPase subunit
MEHYCRLSGLEDEQAAKSVTSTGGGSSGRQEHIDEIFDGLGLSSHRDTIVGDVFLKGLSGGQKRRLSVALEALTGPKNFFLDEPTSGLDSESAYQLLKFLKSYVGGAKGRRVILTIHQPSSIVWGLIDNVILLSRGHLVYQGPRESIEEFFAHCGSPTPPNFNPADHYVSAINDDFTLHEKEPETWADDFVRWSRGRPKDPWVKKCLDDIKQRLETMDADQVARLEAGGRRRSSVIKLMVGVDDGKKEIETSRSGGFFTLVELVRRYCTNLFFNPGILGTRVAMYVMLALIIGALFWNLGYSTTYSSVQSRIALLFYCVAFFVFMSVAVLPFTVIERAIVNKEVKNGYYHPALYHAAQAIASLPGTALLAFLTTLIIITMTKLNAPYWYFLNMFLALNCAEALAQLVSHVVPHFIIGMAGVAAVSTHDM